MDRCPCCNARLRETAICPRCKTDLSVIIHAGKSAQLWLSKAIHYYLENKTEESIAAINLSVCLQKTSMAEVFREFLVQQQCRSILDFLAEKQLLAAKQQLYRVRELFTHSEQLRKLNGFTDYLWLKNNQQPNLINGLKNE